MFVRTMTKGLLRFRAVNAAIAMWLGTMMSWPEWVPAIMFGSLLGWYFHWTDVLMLVLTIQTSADAAATKMLQNHVRGEDEKRETRNDAVLQELQRQAQAAAKRDKMIIATLSAQNDLLEFITKGGFANDTATDRGGTRATRKSNGRSTRKKPKT